MRNVDEEAVTVSLVGDSFDRRRGASIGFMAGAGGSHGVDDGAMGIGRENPAVCCRRRL